MKKSCSLLLAMATLFALPTLALAQSQPHPAPPMMPGLHAGASGDVKWTLLKEESGVKLYFMLGDCGPQKQLYIIPWVQS